MATQTDITDEVLCVEADADPIDWKVTPHCPRCKGELGHYLGCCSDRKCSTYSSWLECPGCGHKALSVLDFE